MSSRLKAVTLAIGTEVVDGQITDRNSAWISDRCVSAGLEVIEHRAVADDRKMIAQALGELSERTDLLFVTGGLGPTSDDFTRDLISEVFMSPLEFHEASWKKIVKRFEDRGAVAKPIQRQQCFFPRGAAVLDNPVGTANAFSMPIVWKGRRVFVVVLPGPPAEIAAIWDAHLAAKIEALVPSAQHEELHSWHTLGVGEGDIAEKVEEAIRGSGLRVGYRVHLPYVEVKVWSRGTDPNLDKLVLEKVEKALELWTTVRGKTDAADGIIKASFAGQNIAILDRVTGGYLQNRLFERLAVFQKANPQLAPKGSLRITTTLLANDLSAHEVPALKGDSVFLSLMPDAEKKQWLVKMNGVDPQTLAVEPTSLYNFGTERGHKYMAEKMFHALSKLAPFV
jgi:nicotinamide-nucleotide amidase